VSATDIPVGEAAAPARTRVPPAAVISWLALAFMTTSSVASLRPSPTMAVYGLACVFLYLVPAIVFLLPTSLVSAELASGWVRSARGAVPAFGRGRFPGPPPEPDVRVAAHPALHEPVSWVRQRWGSMALGCVLPGSGSG